ncbi:MAG: hypothetical protein KGP29_03645 [Proteobacteria bacterium]|nr:hypothetical protein [Pseudomonadota bacterium]
MLRTVLFHRTRDLHFGDEKDMPELISLIGRSFYEPCPALESKELIIKPTNIDEPIFPLGIIVDEDADFAEGFAISEENKGQVVNMLERIAQILKNPAEVFRHLKDLDRAIGEKMRARNIEEIDNSPIHLIAGVGNFIPGPWPKDYRPLKKEKILHRELLERENAAGINLDGVGVFSGFINANSANEFVRDGHVFSENEQASKLLFHGKYSHRLFFEIVRQAIKSGEVDLIIDGKELTQQQLMQIMVYSWNEKSGLSTWSSLIDSTEETNAQIGECDREEYRARALNPDYYCFSSRSPFVFRSLLTCFGRDEIPHLSRYLLDSHYKQVAQMVYKIRGGDESSILSAIPDEFIYTCCMDAMSTGSKFRPEELGPDFPFLTNSIITKTESFNGEYDRNIRRKKDRGDQVDSSHSYESISAYTAHKLSSQTRLK